MQRLVGFVLLWLVIFLPVHVWATQTVNGNLAGTFTGGSPDGSLAVAGNVEGGWTATGTVSQGGVFVENVTGSGTFGGSGISGAWRVTGYSATTKTISVTWAGPGNRGPSSGSSDGSVSLVVDTATGTATGTFQGQVFTDSGVKSISGTWTVRFQGLANTVVTGRVQGSFTGSASSVGAVRGTVSGDWTVRIMPDGSVAGNTTGTYDGGNVGVPGYGSVCICGTWIAVVMRGTDGRYRLEGSWTHPVVSGTLDGAGGGPIVWYLNTDVAPMQATGTFSGATSFTVSLPPPLRSLTVSVSTTGDWNATLPLNP